AHPAEAGGHLGQGLAGLDPALPRLRRARERTELSGDRAHRPGAERVTAVAAVGLHDVEPLLLAGERGVDAVAVGPRARELALVRHAEHRIPEDRRVVSPSAG